MALPSQLTQFTSPILDKALKTGARGVTQTTTNYGVIGDAFFKKAELDLGLANLKADMGIKKAQIMSGLEMQRAQLELQKADVMGNAVMRAAELRAQDVSGTEQLLGTLAGAVQGGTAGFMVGGPWGAVAGAALGGGATYAGYQSGGRQGGQQALQTVGLVSNAAVAVKNFGMEQAKKDGFKNIMDGVNTAKGMMDSATNKQDFDAARGVYEQRVNGMAAGMAKAGWAPDEIASFQSNFSQGNKGIYSMDPSQFNEGYINKMGALMRNDKILNNNPDADVRAQRAQEYLSGASGAMNQLNKYDPTKVMGKAAAISFGEANGQGDVVRDLFNPATPVVRNSIGASQVAIKPAARSASSGSTQRALAPAETQTQAPVAQMPQVQQSGAPMENHIPFAPAPVQVPMAAGVTMDDGMEMFTGKVAAPEQKLAKMGAETVDALNLNPKKGMTDDQEKMSNLKDKFNEWTTPGYKQDKLKAAAAQPQAEQEHSDPAKVEAYKQESVQVNQAIDQKMEEAKKSHLMSDDGLKKAEAIRNTQEGLKKMENLVSKLPNDSQLKALAAKVYLEGLRTGKTGQGLGAAIGLSTGGLAGTIAGNVVGDAMGEVLDGQDVLKGSETTVGKVLSKSEISALNEYHRVASVTVPQAVKTGDGNMVTTPEAREMANNFLNYGQSEEQKRLSVLTMQKDLLTKVSSVAEFSAAGQQQFNYKEGAKINMRAAADVRKAKDVSYQRQLGTNEAKGNLIKPWEEEIGR